MIHLQGVSKRYAVYRRPVDRLLSMLPLVHKASRRDEFWALRDITLDIPEGCTFGIIGPNGAGKSTLLKLIAQTTFPTSGEIQVGGRVAALLELGTGFHPEFTGRQNIYINGKILGLSERQVREREGAIIDFAELGAFIDQPLRTYSSGMIARLGFAVASQVEPDVLIVDEALSVGDAYFSQKCVERIREFKRAGKTILFVSHDPGAILALCDEAALLDKGRVAMRGSPVEALDEYNALIARRGAGNASLRRAETSSLGATAERTSLPAEPPSSSAPALEPLDPGVAPSADDHAVVAEEPTSSVTRRTRRMGNFMAVVDGATLAARSDGPPVDTIVSGEAAWLEVRLSFLAPASDPTVGVMIRDRLGLVSFATNTRFMGERLGDFAPGDRLALRWKFDCHLGPGDYAVTVAAHAGASHVEDCFDWIDGALSFRVAEPPGFKFYGATRLAPVVESTRLSPEPGRVEPMLRELFRDAPPSLSHLDAPEAAPYLSRGWHGPERCGDGRAFRWCEPEAFFALAPSRPIVAMEAAAWARPDGQRVRARLASADGAWSADADWEPGEWAKKEFALPQRLARQPGLFRLTIDPPLEADGRKLGLAVLALRSD